MMLCEQSDPLPSVAGAGMGTGLMGAEVLSLMNRPYPLQAFSGNVMIYVAVVITILSSTPHHHHWRTSISCMPVVNLGFRTALALGSLSGPVYGRMLSYVAHMKSCAPNVSITTPSPRCWLRSFRKISAGIRPSLTREMSSGTFPCMTTIPGQKGSFFCDAHTNRAGCAQMEENSVARERSTLSEQQGAQIEGSSVARDGRTVS
jgi:hypothetical protein